MAYSLADVAPIARRRLPLALAVAVGCYLVLLILGGRLLNDADTYWQIALGRWILAHREVPHTDLFTFTMQGRPWISSQWLAQVLYAGVYRLAGWSGVVVAAALAIAAAFGILARFLLARFATAPALILTAGAFVLASPHMVARPHALAMPVMVAWVAGLVRALDERRAPSFALLPLMMLWANLHGGFTLGLALLAPVALEAIVSATSEQRMPVLRRWATFGVLALTAACITPYGPESMLVTWRVLDLGRALALIGEWQPQNFAHFGGFELCLLAGVGYALYRGLRLPPIRLLVLLGLLHMGLSASRNGEVLGLLAPVFIAAPLAPQVGASDQTSAASHVRVLPSLALILLFVLLTAAIASAANYRPRAAVTPAAAVAALKASGATHVLNSYDFGGYLIAAGVKPFIDGRTELFGERFMLDHDRALRLQDVAGFLRLLQHYRIDATLLAPSTPANGLLEHLKGWKRIYADDIAVVYVRTAATQSAPELR